MRYSRLTALLAFCLCVGSLAAEDYLLKIETHGYIDAVVPDDFKLNESLPDPQSGKPPARREGEPEQKLLRSIEVIVRPDADFRTKSVNGKQTIRLTGRMTSKGDGKFDVTFRHAMLTISDTTVLVEEGVEEPIINITEMQTQITADLDQSVMLGDSLSATQTKDGIKRVTKNTSRLKLTRYEPSDDE